MSVPIRLIRLWAAPFPSFQTDDGKGAGQWCKTPDGDRHDIARIWAKRFRIATSEALFIHSTNLVYGWLGRRACLPTAKRRAHWSGPEDALKWDRNGMRIGRELSKVRGNDHEVAHHREADSFNKITGPDVSGATSISNSGTTSRLRR